MNAFTVCVDYHDVFCKVLPLQRHFFDRWFVATSLEFRDQTLKVCKDNRCDLFVTDAFTRGGAVFNKWLALEELLDYGGREGWLCLHDADTVWSRSADLSGLVPGKLYSPLRFVYPEVSRVPPESEWVRYPIHRNVAEWAGYTQIFHASDPVLGPPPWHETDWKHAGGADSFFQRKWKKEDKVRPPWYALHLGPCGANWAGRVSAYADGTTPAQADVRSGTLKDYFARRSQTRSYDHEKLR